MTDRPRDPRTGRYLNPGGFAPPPSGAPHQVSTPVPVSNADIASAHARAEARAAERLQDAERGGRPAEDSAEGGGRAEGQTSLVLSPRETGPQGAGGAESAEARTPQPPRPGDGQPVLSEGQRAGRLIEPSANAAGDGQADLTAGQERAGRPFLDPIRPPPAILGHAPQPEPEPAEPSALDELTDAFKATHPAASSTDSPSRGIPTPSGDPGKQITGGWGPTGSGSEYFALDGSELKAIVIALAARLQQALDGDLRFGLSVVYPQVKISLRLTVDGRSPEGRDLDLPGREKIDLEWSRILALDAEVEDSDETPAGKIRDDFEIRGPKKQIIRAGAARLLVDVPNEPAGS